MKDNKIQILFVLLFNQLQNKGSRLCHSNQIRNESEQEEQRSCSRRHAHHFFPFDRAFRDISCCKWGGEEKGMNRRKYDQMCVENLADHDEDES
jgi:hypothetical protein